MLAAETYADEASRRDDAFARLLPAVSFDTHHA